MYKFILNRARNKSSIYFAVIDVVVSLCFRAENSAIHQKELTSSLSAENPRGIGTP